MLSGAIPESGDRLSRPAVLDEGAWCYIVGFMKQAFFDESSNHEVFLIAGWIGDVPEWERFNDHWRAVLAEAPAIRHFKHHHAMSFEGDFTGWTERPATQR